MPNPTKVEKVNELKEQIESAQGLFLADFRGLTVGESTELRRSLRESGTRFSVVKNTLMKRALSEAGLDGELESLLQGPTAVAFIREDPVAVAKSLVDAARRFRALVLKGAYVEGRVLPPEQTQALATIEPREVLLAKVAGAALAEMSRAAYMFKALQGRFLSVLEAFREKLPGDPVTAEAAEEPAEERAEEAPAASEDEPTTEEPEAETSEEGKE